MTGRGRLIAATVAGLSLATIWLTAGQAAATNRSSANVTVKVLAQGPVKALPKGKVFLSILEFRQVPGADFGPHQHQASIAYTLQGVDTISFPGAAAQSVGPTEAAFIPALVTHTHQNLEGRIGTGAIATGLIVAVLLLCAATWLRGPRRRVAVAALSVSLIVGGAWALLGTSANDYYLLAVRPEVQRTWPMPRPDGHVVFSSPDIDPLPAAPYTEKLGDISVPAGAQYETPDSPGPQMIVVVGGAAAVTVGGETTQLGIGGAALAQEGQVMVIVNSGSDALRVLDFAVTSASAVPAPA